MHGLKFVGLRWHVLHLRLHGTLRLMTSHLLQILHYGCAMMSLDIVVWCCYCRYDQGGKSAVQSSTSSANSRAVKGGGSKDEESKRHEIVTIALLPAGLSSPLQQSCHSSHTPISMDQPVLLHMPTTSAAKVPDQQ